MSPVQGEPRSNRLNRDVGYPTTRLGHFIQACELLRSKRQGKDKQFAIEPQEKRFF